MVHEGGRVKNLQKTVHMVYGCPLIMNNFSDNNKDSYDVVKNVFYYFLVITVYNITKNDLI